jgi:putative tryptophan/tyrosine transport system substrate-binding protein
LVGGTGGAAGGILMLSVRRREFFKLLGCGVAWPLAARAQSSGKVYRIGFLGVTSYADRRSDVDALRTGLRRLGYEEGKNIVVQYRWAEGQYDRLPELAAELVKLNIDVLVTHSTPGALAVKGATSTIPVVFSAVADPIESGLVASLARPGGNLTGLTFFSDELVTKRLEFIKEAIPTLTRVAVLVNPANPGNLRILSVAQRTASVLGVELMPTEVKARDDIADAIVTVARGRARALTVFEDPLSIANARQTAEFALHNGLPMIGFKPHAEAGALMEYGVDLADLFYRSAAFVDKILKATPPSDLPIERAVKFDLVVNLKSAKTLGIELSTSLLLRANEVIE